MSAARVDVLGRPNPLGQSQVEREPAFQKPTVRGSRGQSGEQAVEREALSVTREAGPLTGGRIL